jgi:hypothetical protein
MATRTAAPERLKKEWREKRKEEVTGGEEG